MVEVVGPHDVVVGSVAAIVLQCPFLVVRFLTRHPAVVLKVQTVHLGWDSAVLQTLPADVLLAGDGGIGDGLERGARPWNEQRERLVAEDVALASDTAIFVHLAHETVEVADVVGIHLASLLIIKQQADASVAVKHNSRIAETALHDSVDGLVERHIIAFGRFSTFDTSENLVDSVHHAAIATIQAYQTMLFAVEVETGILPLRHLTLKACLTELHQLLNGALIKVVGTAIFSINKVVNSFMEFIIDRDADGRIAESLVLAIHSAHQIGEIVTPHRLFPQGIKQLSATVHPQVTGDIVLIIFPVGPSQQIAVFAIFTYVKGHNVIDKNARGHLVVAGAAHHTVGIAVVDAEEFLGALPYP